MVAVIVVWCDGVNDKGEPSNCTYSIVVMLVMLIFVILNTLTMVISFHDNDGYLCSCLELPYNDYFEYFGPDFKLHISPSNMPNSNQQEYLDRTKWVFVSSLHYLNTSYK